jgi:hypothetical protein
VLIYRDVEANFTVLATPNSVSAAYTRTLWSRDRHLIFRRAPSIGLMCVYRLSIIIVLGLTPLHSAREVVRYRSGNRLHGWIGRLLRQVSFL